MNAKLIVALVVVAFAVATQGTKPTPRKTPIKKSTPLNSADVEALLDPTVQSLANGQHKLVFKGAAGQEQCVVCQPFQGCGCRDVVAIRCELKRLKQKLLRLKRIAQPHKRSHHERDEQKPVVKVAPKYVKPLVKPAVVKPKAEILIKPAVKPVVQVKPAVLPVVQVKPAVEPVVKPLIKVRPAIKAASKKYVQSVVARAPKKSKPIVQVKPAVQPVVQVKPAVQPVEQPLVKVAVVKPVLV